MDGPRIDYPCWWTYAVIGRDEEDLRLAIGEIVAGLPHRVDYSRLSERRNYVSLHVDIEVGSESQRNDIFAAFQSHPKVRMVL